jgi:hypothetical protein
MWEYSELIHYPADCWVRVKVSPAKALKTQEELQAKLVDLGLEPGVEERGKENGMIVFSGVSRIDVLNALNTNGWEPVTDEGKVSVLFKRRISRSARQENTP